MQNYPNTDALICTHYDRLEELHPVQEGDAHCPVCGQPPCVDEAAWYSQWINEPV